MYTDHQRQDINLSEPTVVEFDANCDRYRANKYRRMDFSFPLFEHRQHREMEDRIYFSERGAKTQPRPAFLSIVLHTCFVRKVIKICERVCCIATDIWYLFCRPSGEEEEHLLISAMGGGRGREQNVWEGSGCFHTHGPIYSFSEKVLGAYSPLIASQLSDVVAAWSFRRNTHKHTHPHTHNFHTQTHPHTQTQTHPDTHTHTHNFHTQKHTQPPHTSSPTHTNTHTTSRHKHTPSAGLLSGRGGAALVFSPTVSSPELSAFHAMTGMPR